MDKVLLEPEKVVEFKVRGNNKYEVEVIMDSKVYDQQTNDQIPGLYYLILWKGYLEEENT